MNLFEEKSARPMLIGAVGKAFDDPDFVFELKLDGERCLAYCDEGRTTLINTRGHYLLPKLPELSSIHQQTAGRCILDGELMVENSGRPDFEKIQNRVMQKSPLRIDVASKRYPAIFVVFDILYRGGQQLTNLPFTERRGVLEDTVRENERLGLSRVIEARGRDFFALAREQQLEGIIAKSKQSTYLMGRRTKDWIKIKNIQDDEYVICGYIPKEGHVVSLVLGQYNAKGQLVYKGHTTLGVARGDYGFISGQPKAEHSPFSGKLPPGNKGVIWLEPRLVCTVEFLLRTPSGLMRHPRYKGLRPDKRPAEAVEAR